MTSSKAEASLLAIDKWRLSGDWSVETDNLSRKVAKHNGTTPRITTLTNLLPIERQIQLFWTKLLVLGDFPFDTETADSPVLVVLSPQKYEKDCEIVNNWILQIRRLCSVDDDVSIHGSSRCFFTPLISVD